jgi:hypothetical protein
MFSLAADGKTNGRGLPNPFRLAVIMYDHFDLVGLGFPPAWIQRSWLLLGARAGGCSAIRPRIAERGSPRPHSQADDPDRQQGPGGRRRRPETRCERCAGGLARPPLGHGPLCWRRTSKRASDSWRDAVYEARAAMRRERVIPPSPGSSS